MELIGDFTRERLTIGGALLLRQEAEILAQIKGKNETTLHIICPESNRVAAEGSADKVFCSSILLFHLICASIGVEGWPSSMIRSHSDFSFFSFTRFTAIYKETGIKSKLGWCIYQAALAKQARISFPGRLICVHLRSVVPFIFEESNA